MWLNPKSNSLGLAFLDPTQPDPWVRSIFKNLTHGLDWAGFLAGTQDPVRSLIFLIIF